VREALRRRFPSRSAPRRAARALARARKRLRRRLLDRIAPLAAPLLPGRLLRDRRYFALWERRGFHALPVHFTSPVPDTRALPPALWERTSAAVGIDWNERAQLALLATLRDAYRAEYDAFPTERSDDPFRFTLANASFGPIDAEVLHAMVRHLEPRRVIEIGSGHSTLLIAAALERNRAEGHPGELIAIEPYPDRRLARGFPGLSRLIAQPVQDVPLAEFEALGARDILFIDSSHVLKIGSDVQVEWLEIVPRLAPGVVVHVHDIFLPAEYPRTWVLDAHRFYGEQYLLQAFLAFNRAFEVLWAAQYMCLRHPEAVRGAFRSVAGRPLSAGSFWIRRVDEPR
jgi:predicted O-methyltransferase YrrM